MTFFTVAPEFKGKGFGLQVWSKCVREARQGGYDGVLHYCVEGNRSNAVTVAGCRMAGYEPVQAFRVSYLMHLISKASPIAAQSEAIRDSECGIIP